MLPAPTMYQRKMAVRRKTADIERLSKTYQTGMFDVLQQQQTAFQGWQKENEKLLKPYEDAVKQYATVDFPAYEKALAQYNTILEGYEKNYSAYKDRLNQHQSLLAEIEKNPFESVEYTKKQAGRTWVYIIDGKQYNRIQDLEAAGFFLEGDEILRKKDIPVFTEKPPEPLNIEAPKAPKEPGPPPKIKDFDDKPYVEKRGVLDTTYKREVGERKSAAMNAVTRRMGRGMLQGV